MTAHPPLNPAPLGFRPLTWGDLPLLHRRLNAPHVRMWWASDGSRLGHRGIRITADMYAHVTPEMQRDAIKGTLMPHSFRVLNSRSCSERVREPKTYETASAVETAFRCYIKKKSGEPHRT